MAIARLRFVPLFLLAGGAILLGPPNTVRACGRSFEDAPPTLPYYLDRLPAKPPAWIFQETFGGPIAATAPCDFKAALLALAGECEGGSAPASSLATVDTLLTRARLDPAQPAALCNLLNDARDLFASVPTVAGASAADYLRWRVEHARWFHLSWDGKRPEYDDWAERQDAEYQQKARDELTRQSNEHASDPLAPHWLYLRAAYDFLYARHNLPFAGADLFERVTQLYPNSPRAESARFMLARCRLTASRRHDQGYGAELSPEDAASATRERGEARALFEDYLHRYPKGRFAADVPGWLGALAFADEDYLGALEYYLAQANVPGHPEVLKSSGFMCERCLSNLADAGDQEALRRVAAQPRLAMSLIYLLVNADEAPADPRNPDNPDAAGQPYDTPARVTRWRRGLLPRLAVEVARRKEAYAGKDWEPRYLAILAQAASGAGDQAEALRLCGLASDELARSDDLAFIRLVALARARRFPEAVAAGRDFARLFPQSLLAPGAALRTALALRDDHQVGAALVELRILKGMLAAQAKEEEKNGREPLTSTQSNYAYPPPDFRLDAARSILRRDTSGAEAAQVDQLIDALLNFAPLSDLAAALAPGAVALDSGDKMTLRATLVQRWLAEEENFREAAKYATPTQWSLAARAVEELDTAARSAPAGEARAAACLRLADGWAGARGRLTFSPLETDQARGLFADRRERADIFRRENGIAFGVSAEKVNRNLAGRDEWAHAFHWWLEAADAAPVGSPIRATALWSALRAMPSMAVASPYTFLRAGETDASGLSRRLCERLRRECPESREAREFAVYYNLAPPDMTAYPDLTEAETNRRWRYDEPEYRWYPLDEDYDAEGGEDGGSSEATRTLKEAYELAEAFREPDFVGNPPRLAAVVAELRARLRVIFISRGNLCLVNFLDDLAAFLQEPAAGLTPGAVRRYVDLRLGILHGEPWSPSPTAVGMAYVPEATGEMAPFKDYLDFLKLAILANQYISVPIPGEMEDGKDEELGQRHPVTYADRDYPKLVTMAGVFLADYPHSRKRAAARLLQARALYSACRPTVVEKFAVWPGSGHFASGRVVVTHRQQPLIPEVIRAALDDYDREFPGDSRYAADIRNLRGLLAWRTCDWPLALDLTLQTAADSREPVLQSEGIRRLNSIFVDGLTEENERARCLAAIKARPGAAEKLREFLPKSPFPLRVLQSWLLARL